MASLQNPARLLPVAAALGAASLLLAACGSDEASSPVESAAPAASFSVQKGAPATDVVLTSDELPVGVKSVPLTAQQTKQVTDGLSGVAADTTITPSKCKNPNPFGAKFDATGAGMVTGQAGTGAVSEVVLKKKGDLSAVRKNISGDCAKITATARQGTIVVTSRVGYSVVPVPRTAADSVVAFRQDRVSAAGGRSSTSHFLTAWAVVGDYTLTVSQNGSTGEPDKRLFDVVLASAIAKAAQAK
ncbi:hypothetical protein P0W64_17940 [Tsukamurella sp. 8F]|uniref:hypothetical protein n=1 Tax=unclassified Tsukamurella TaxID=2633480 RepID=UPI0023B8CB93|nr:MULTISPECIES: hypothetical protein [unclassified Tsukamurella]MDF0529878.1 hypothetical protein [Tsukamurella sp. 8J]MDF0588667.1 hypothetical protein [Tsukamurella sp. 8F]